MRHFRTTIVLALATFLSISICSAQQAATTSVPNLVRYSGTLKDAQGASLSSSTAVGVTFSIYKQQDGGAAVWMETQNVTPDSNGQYNVTLGSTTATGLPDDLFLQQEQRWLGVQVQGEAELARVLLVSVPYAFKAHEAETLGGLPASAFVKAPPSDGSGNGSTGADNGTSVNALGTAGKAGGTAAPGGIKTVSDCLNPRLGAITLWSRQIQINPPIWELCNSNLFQVLTGPFTGNIGIGPIPGGPSEPLDVFGAISTYKWYDINEQRIVSVNNTGQAPSTSTNLFLGWDTGTNNIGNTNNNTFGGRRAGFTNNRGQDNTFYGYKSGFANTTASANTFVGYQAGTANITGAGNTFVGANAGLVSNTIKNTFLGYAAGSNSIGGFNTCTGYDACQSNTIGIANACFGENACLSLDAIGNLQLTTGSANTCLGTGACSSTNIAFNGGNNICVGSAACNAEHSPNNSIEIGNDGHLNYGNGSIQIGTTGTQVAKTYVAGIFDNITTFSPMVPVVTVTSTGHLGWQNITPGGGGVGPCSLGANYLTKWTSTTTVDCSRVWENPTSPYFVGIGPGFGSTDVPLRQLDVRGEINAGNIPLGTKQHYQIIGQTVLSIDGTENTFVGVNAGTANAGGLDNTFVGEQAGRLGVGGTANTFVGQSAGRQNAGFENVFVGQFAGPNNLNGQHNAFLGVGTGLNNITGSDNTFVGYSAGNNNNGNASGNTFVGSNAGLRNIGGSNNIDLGNQGCPSAPCGESNIIRIGTLGTQTDTYIQGIYRSAMSSPPLPYETVCVDSSGKLFSVTAFSPCNPSSRRFKEQIADMGDGSNKLFQLRPVTFFYKPQSDDGSRLLQYGLIAEEVAKVYPELVAYEKDGQPYTVKYQLLAPLLLNEFQKQHKVVAAQQDELQTQLQQIETQQQQMQAQRQEIDGLKLQLQQQNASLQERLTKLESYVATQMKTASDNPSRTAPGANGGLQ